MIHRYLLRFWRYRRRLCRKHGSWGWRCSDGLRHWGPKGMKIPLCGANPPMGVVTEHPPDCEECLRRLP